MAFLDRENRGLHDSQGLLCHVFVSLFCRIRLVLLQLPEAPDDSADATRQRLHVCYGFA